jgi:precorrin-6B methylase 2
MSDLTLIRVLPSRLPGQVRELYRLQGEYVVISTVDLGAGLSPEALEFARLASIIVGIACEGEETMAFACDENGESLCLTPIEIARGEGSRAIVLARLQADRR